MTVKTKNEKVYDYLTKLGVSFISIKHSPVFTCNEECEEMKGVDVLDIKNLFLKDKKGKKHFLVIAPYEKEINLKSLADEFDTNSLSFASEERLLKYLGVNSGAVSIFGLLNDVNSEVILVIDKSILKPGNVGFHPNINTETLIFSNEDLIKIINTLNNEIIYMD